MNHCQLCNLLAERHLYREREAETELKSDGKWELLVASLWFQIQLLILLKIAAAASHSMVSIAPQRPITFTRKTLRVGVGRNQRWISTTNFYIFLYIFLYIYFYISRENLEYI